LTEGEYELLSEAAYRKAVANYSEGTISKKYIEVYNKITGVHG
jgi:glycosyltransferase involved in cell wall biosynthesis